MKPDNRDHDHGATNQSELIMGAPAIARLILGSDSPSDVRRIRHLHETGRLPTFKLQKLLCLRPATWREYLAEREAEADTRRKEGRPTALVGA